MLGKMERQQALVAVGKIEVALAALLALEPSHPEPTLDAVQEVRRKVRDWRDALWSEINNID